MHNNLSVDYGKSYGFLHNSGNGITVRAEVSHLQSLKNGSKEYIPNSR